MGLHELSFIGSCMSWTCQHCHTGIEEDAFELCWNCGCEKGQSAPAQAQTKQLKCLRCESNMLSIGSKEFHEGRRWGVLGNIGELLVDKLAFDVLACSSCGKVEFFLPQQADTIPN